MHQLIKQEIAMPSTWDPQSLRLSGEYVDKTGYWYQFDELLEERKSQWQTIRVARHAVFGKVLMLDTDIMDSENDETYDTTLLSLLPLYAKNILIMGGGDCSLASKLCDMDTVEKITVCDIDPEVVAVCNKWLPRGLTDKVWIYHEDAFKFLEAHKDEFDLLIDDMIPQPHNANENYWLDLARTFRGKCVIGQTGGYDAGLPGKIKTMLKEAGCEVSQINKYIPTYLENWTFTRYRLP